MGARYAKFLYALHLLVGLIVAIWQVFNGFQVSTTQGLLILLPAVVAYFFWIPYVRIGLEFLVAIFRAADTIIRTAGSNRES